MMRSVTVLAAVLVSAGLVACGGGSADTQTEPATTEAPATETATTEPATTFGGTTDDNGTTEAEDGTTAGTTETTDDTGGGADVVARIALVAGEPQGGEKTVEATNGQSVRIVVRSDQADELHLHGYDIEKEAAPGKPAVFAFRADLEGIWELESHVSHGVIARVVVNP